MTQATQPNHMTVGGTLYIQLSIATDWLVFTARQHKIGQFVPI